MPVLDVFSGNQIEAVGGRRPRPVLGDLLLAASADLPRRLAFQQRQRELALQEEEQRLNAQALARQEQAQGDAAAEQRRAQRQQLIGTAISGVGQAGQLALLAKNTGVLQGLGVGGGAAATTGGVTAAEAAGLAGEGALFGATSAPGAAAGGAAAGGAAAGGAASGALSTLSAGAGAAAVGAGAGYGLSKAPIPRYGSALAGAGAGAGLGALYGTFAFPGLGTAAGAIIGGIAGGLTGGLCIILTACAENAEEVALAKRYRERGMSPEAKRGYYMLAEPIAARMQADEAYCQMIRHVLVLPLLRYGAYELGESAQRPSMEDWEMAGAFLDLCASLGQSVSHYVRDTGEVV